MMSAHSLCRFGSLGCKGKCHSLHLNRAEKTTFGFKGTRDSACVLGPRIFPSCAEWVGGSAMISVHRLYRSGSLDCKETCQHQEPIFGLKVTRDSMCFFGQRFFPSCAESIEGGAVMSVHSLY